MSTKSKLANVISSAIFLISVSSQAIAGESVQSWIGVIEDFSGSHDPEHNGDHPLKFTRSSDGETFYITEGDEEIRKEHLRTDNSMAVKIDGRVTSKFLFFGGNLVVGKFEKLADISPIEHKRVVRFRDFERNLGRRSL